MTKSSDNPSKLNKEVKMTRLEKRFWHRVEKSDGCWTWLGGNGGSPYGRFQIDGVRLFAHRLSYMLNVGSIDSDLVINHVCLNKRCVNPSHLEAVTPQKNTEHYQDNRYGW